ncbi:ATP-binding cassette domain-containing protein [Tundrisphaera lichenicola]|uniref:ATP-binding cassette domain-containing protein n=1 Tax=Tundrisphaera lichenicola TaxID=2029860 RepID=UPI003EB6FB16
MALVSMRGVSIAFGGPKLLDGVDWQVERGERVGLVGRNGAGKSTLLKLLHGDLRPDEGDVIRPQGVRIARLIQEVPEGRGGSVFEEVAAGVQEAGEGHTPDHAVDRVLSRMKLDPDAPFESLSSGMKRRVLLARALVLEPDALLLDEPTNHLDIESIRWLEDYLLRFGGTLVFVTHDRTFLGRLATRIVEVDRGRLFDWSCDYPTFLERKEAALAAEERQEALFDKRLAQEEVWIRKGIQARRTRNEGRVRALKALREERRERRERTGNARMLAQEAERSGSLVIEAKESGFAYGDRKIIDQASLAIMRGDKVGLIGPNGSGKTTLLRLLLGELEPTTGSVRQGTNLEVAYFDQLRATLDEDKTVQQNVSEYDSVVINGQPRHVIGYLQDFLFPPERSRTLVRLLSGGERNRLLLARLFTKPSNLLVLDEPTNDLDVETLELLESLLIEYQGTILLVSHDRTFLNNVATSVLSVEPDGQVRESAGGYDDWLRRSVIEAEARVEAAPTTPKGTPAASKDKPKKLAFKEKRELEELPKKIEALEIEQAQLHDEMGRPGFYQRDRDEIARATARLEQIGRELATAFERWESLEALA